MNGSLTFRLLQAIGFSLFVFSFLFFFRPFGIETMPMSLWFITSGFAGATFIPMVLLNMLIPKLFKNYFNDKKWTVGREIFWTTMNVFIIGFCNYLFYNYAANLPFSFGRILWFQGSTIAIGAFPVVILTLWRENKDRRKFSIEADIINDSIQESQNDLNTKENEPELESKAIVLDIPSLNASEDLSILMDDFLFIQSSDNYIDVFYLKNGTPTKAVLRNTLKAIEDVLSENENLFRCHKSYLVNLHHVHHISGNAQGYKLHLNHTEEIVSVSRGHNETIKSRLANRH